MLPNSLSSPSITCKYYTTPAYHLPMAFLSCPAPHLEAPSLLLYPIDAGLFPSAFYYATAHFTSERGLHVSALHPAVLSISLSLYLLLLFLSLFLLHTFLPLTTPTHTAFLCDFRLNHPSSARRS